MSAQPAKKQKVPMKEKAVEIFKNLGMKNLA
jgi:hypothetical protein